MDKLPVTDSPLEVKAIIEQYEFREDNPEHLRYVQFICKEFFTHNLIRRGLLVAFKMGLGKTKLAVAIAEKYIQDHPLNNVHLLSSKSLHTNFYNTIVTETKKSDAEIKKRYKFISLNASNMLAQVFNLKKTDDEIRYEKSLGDFMADVTKKNTLNNSLLIVDEAHNLFNSICNGGQNAIGLYDLIMEAKNLKILFLTGTPIRNEPFEVVPCYNMLYGPIEDKTPPAASSNAKTKKKKRTFNTLFSEDSTEFEEFFVDKKANRIKNADKFKNRIFGLTCYYGDLYIPATSVQEGFPKKLPDIVEKVPMSKVQFSRYLDARIKEQAESKFVSGKKSRFSSSRSSNSTYRVASRQISNYCIPEYALGPAVGKKSREKFIDKITDVDISNDDYSPKFAKIYANLLENKGKLQIVYSQFVSGEGLALFARYLNAKGYASFHDDADDTMANSGSQLRYAMLTGDIDVDTRQSTIDIFNDVSNSHGEKISLLLFSGAVAEGIDLKRVRAVHIMEPFWNYARIKQVETRAIRYGSHTDLPPSEQNVQVYIYVSDYPKDYPKEKKVELTTDIDLLSGSIKNMHLINTFDHAVAESSIDCAVHAKSFPAEIRSRIHCQLCRPTNRPLYLIDLQEDMQYKNPCVLFEQQKVKAKPITITDDGKQYTYYYKKKTDADAVDNFDKVDNFNAIEIFEYDKKINGYIPMRLANTHYSLVMAALREANAV